MKCAQVISLTTTLLVLSTFQWSSVVSSDITTDFGLDLYKKISSKNEGKNCFFSPLSISTAFGMLLLGSGGSTRTQIKTALKLNSFKTDDDIYMEFKRIIQALEAKGDKNTVHLVDQLFLSDKLTFNPVFVKDLLKYFKSTLQGLDFSKPEECRVKINDWVSKKTDGKIKDFLPKGIIKSSMVLQVIGTIHVQANWQYPFDLKNTKPGTFTTSKNEKITMNMMHLSPKLLNYGVSDELNSEIIELPFIGDRLVMYILLPREGKFRAAQKSLTKAALIKVVDSLTKSLVQVTLPKFITDQRIPLTNHVKSLGMTNVFDEMKSNLSGILTKSKRVLYASEIAHKTFLDINEYGLLTDTVTEVPVDSPLPVKPIIAKFNVNRPFMFLIKEKKANITLHCGHVLTKPALNDVLHE